MAKKKEEVVKEDVIEKKDEDVKKSPDNFDNVKYNIETFIEENADVKKRRTSGAGFKAWHTIKNKNNKNEKKTIGEWSKLFNKFMTEPTGKRRS